MKQRYHKWSPIRGSGERNGEQRRTKVAKLWQNHVKSIGTTAVGEKAHLRTLNSEKIKPIALTVFELHLFEGISQIVSQLLAISQLNKKKI